MNTPDKIKVYTVPTRYTRVDCEPTPEPYERVVGIDVAGERLWSPRAQRYDVDGLLYNNALFH